MSNLKLYFDLGNTDACKIAIAGELTSGLHIVFHAVKPDEKIVGYFIHSHLPVLEISSAQYLFSSNSACRYVLSLGKPGDAPNGLDDTWLEWEATLLKPAVHRIVTSTSNKATAGVHADIQPILAELESFLKSGGSGELCRSTASAISIWCSLYPIMSQMSPHIGLRSDCLVVSGWFDRLAADDAFVRGMKRIIPENNPFSAICTSFASQLVLSGRKEAICSGPHGDDKKKLPGSGEEESNPSSVTAEELSLAETAFIHGLKRSSPDRKVRTPPILPQAGERNLLITSALPYVNNVPHLGNIIGCVLSADVFARFCRLRGYNTLYICGTDEYGTATETKALEEGLTPQQICDKYHVIHAAIYDWFEISFDYFGRTTTQQQTRIAQDIFWGLYKNGFVIKDSIEQLLCEHCNRFLADRFVEGTCPFCAYDGARGDQCDKCGKLINAVELKSPRCKICGKTPVVKSSDHLFLDLPSVEPRLVKHLDAVFEKGIWTSNSKMITRAWIRDGLKPRCISRDLKWGTPVPLEGYTDKVFYVWYDAPIGYISITANYTDQWERWWKNPSQVDLFNFMAKDNVPFHAVIFPCSLLGTDEPWTVVNNMSATEYLNYEDGKFSKSRGLGVFGDNARETGIPADVFRFYLLYVRPESQDSTFSWDDLMTKTNSELLNNLGNFVNRALMFVANNFGGRLQKIDLTTEDKELLVHVTRELKTYVDNLEQIRLRDGIRNILNISTLGNQYMQANKPWVLVKGTDAERARAGSVISLAANLSYLLSVLVTPYMPGVAAMIQSQLNADATSRILDAQFVQYLPEEHRINEPKPLFQKIESPQIQKLKARFGGPQEKPPGESKVNENSTPVVTPPVVDNSDGAVARLTRECEQQGEIVRKLKTEKADKSKIDAEVKKLLDLKTQLAAAQGITPTDTTNNPGQKKKKGKK